MRVRTGNPYSEVHGKSMRVYEFVTNGTQDTPAIVTAIEAATGLRFRGDPAGVDGFINTSLRPDGSRFVAIVLYEACADATHGHPPLRRAADLNAAKQTALATAVGEHAQHRLTGNAQDDATKLRALGFTDDDPPLR